MATGYREFDDFAHSTVSSKLIFDVVGVALL